jgi:transcriptional regulator with XRE-family HTH domain
MATVIGERIEQLRSKLGMSQAVLAAQMNVTRGTVSNWERGITFPNWLDLQELCRIFSVSGDFMLSDEHIGIKCDHCGAKIKEGSKQT